MSQKQQAPLNESNGLSEAMLPAAAACAPHDQEIPLWDYIAIVDKGQHLSFRSLLDVPHTLPLVKLPGHPCLSRIRPWEHFDLERTTFWSTVEQHSSRLHLSVGRDQGDLASPCRLHFIEDAASVRRWIYPHVTAPFNNIARSLDRDAALRTELHWEGVPCISKRDNLVPSGPPSKRVRRESSTNRVAMNHLLVRIPDSGATAAVIEVKSPFRCPAPALWKVFGLKVDIDVGEVRKASAEPQDSMASSARYLDPTPRNLYAWAVSLVTPLFSHMLNESVEFGAITTGTCILFCALDADDPSQLKYSFHQWPHYGSKWYQTGPSTADTAQYSALGHWLAFASLAVRKGRKRVQCWPTSELWPAGEALDSTDEEDNGDREHPDSTNSDDDDSDHQEFPDSTFNSTASNASTASTASTNNDIKRMSRIVTNDGDDSDNDFKDCSSDNNCEGAEAPAQEQGPQANPAVLSSPLIGSQRCGKRVCIR